MFLHAAVMALRKGAMGRTAGGMPAVRLRAPASFRVSCRAIVIAYRLLRVVGGHGLTGEEEVRAYPIDLRQQRNVLRVNRHQTE
jgi:hypothetical protein